MSFEGQQLGRYRLQQQLGSGGMGEVYLATDAHINRQVAVKIIRDGASAYPNEEATKESARLFQREMRAIAVLDHPHILPLYDYGEETVGRTTLTYMVMPYRKEGSLADWLQQRGKGDMLSLQEVTRLIRQAASALQQAHNHQIIHQDVKPSNFLIHVTEDEPDQPNLQLADFGVAKFSSATSTVSHAIRGTPSYMAPEQWEGTPVPATDQYALAIMAYELLTGRPPFQGGMGQMMYQHFNAPPQPPSTLNPAIPRDLDTVLLHALAKKPEERFASIAAFSRAFQEATKGMNEGTIVKASPTPIPPPAPPTSAPLPPTVPAPIRGNDLRVTLAISQQEASTGTTRTLTLPGGRRTTVSIPARAYHGQTIHLAGQGEPSPTGTGEAGALIITISIALKEESKPALNPQQAGEKTFLSGPVPLKAEAQPPISNLTATKYVHPKNETQPPISNLTATRPASPTRRSGLSYGWAVALIGLAVLIVIGSGAIYFTRSYAPDPYPPSNGASARVVVNDSLSDNTSSWDQGNNSTGNCQFTEGAYHVTAASFNNCINSIQNFSNFTYEVQMTIITGFLSDSGGITFRASDSSDYYYCSIGLDSTYQIGLVQNNKVQTPLKTGSSPLISTGLNETNTLAVVANGSDLEFYINGQKFASINDSTYTSGQIGVIAYSNSGNSIEVAFNNAKVWTM